MAETVFNRYRNVSKLAQTFFDESGNPVRVVEGGTVVAAAGSAIARSRFTVIIQRDVGDPADNFEDAEALETPRSQRQRNEVPQHENTNPTNTSPATAAADGLRTVLTDEFDGSGGVGAVNTSAADPAGTMPETPTPEADLSPKQTQAEADAEKKSGSKTKGK
jgi:hypothetical protein